MTRWRFEVGILGGGSGGAGWDGCGRVGVPFTGGFRVQKPLYGISRVAVMQWFVLREDGYSAARVEVQANSRGISEKITPRILERLIDSGCRGV